MSPETAFSEPFTPAGHIAGVRIRRLVVNRDQRGILVETLRGDWPDFYDPQLLPFAQSYYSVTEPNMARDDDRWHVHSHQEDRFAVLSGEIVVAIHDPRPDSPTKGRINLFRMGERLGDERQYALLIPKLVHHGFVVGPERPAVLINFPTKVYNPKDEGRIPFAEVGARLDDGRLFTWDLVRESLRV